MHTVFNAFEAQLNTTGTFCMYLLLNTLKLGSMPLFHFTGSTLWAQLYPPTLFVAFFGLHITFDRVLPPPCWYCRRLLGLFFMGFPGVTDLMRYDRCEVWIVVTVVRYELYYCCHLLTHDCSGCWRLLPFSASGWVGFCLTGPVLQSQAPKGTFQKRFSGFCPLRGSPPPYPLNEKSVWKKEGFFP